MTKEAREAQGGSVTVAVRDSVVNGMEVHEGEYLGILNDKIVCTGSSIAEVLEKMLADGDYEAISMYYGAGLSEDEANELAEGLENINEDWEVDVFYGGQPLYPVLLAME